MSKKSYTIVQQTNGYLYYTVEADSEEEALGLVNSGKVDYDTHDWDSDAPFVEYVDE